MKMPRVPPNWGRLQKEILAEGGEVLSQILTRTAGPLAPGRYLHWDQLVHRVPPKGLTHEQWWFGLKMARRTMFKDVPLWDGKGAKFKRLEADPIPEMLQQIDLGAGGLIKMPEQITNPSTRDAYAVSSLMEEAITSSQLEGAATTRQVAKDMLRSGRPPRDRNERMILNNFATMIRIGRVKEWPLTKELVFELHRFVTQETLDDPYGAGRFRRPDERIEVRDDYGQIFHDPPPAEQLESRMADMCDFANSEHPDFFEQLFGDTKPPFVHPVVRSIILHFWLAYDHPFVDGNGRTARALFYWSMLHHGYRFFEYISISQIFLMAPAQYRRAFLYTETDENDLTYFILYHLDVIHRAIKGLHKYIEHKSRQLQAIEQELRVVATLNHRQRVLVSHALRHPDHRYTIRSHRVSHNVVYQTARTDLFNLRDRRLLEVEKVGKVYYFTPVKDLEDVLRRLS